MQIPDGKSIEDVPPEIAYLWMASMSNVPVGCSTVDKAMELYPEYFPEEVEHRRKMSHVPQQIWDSYFTELMALHDWWYSELPASKGIIYVANHPKEANNWWQESDELHRKYDKEEMERRIWNKHYTLWGLKKQPPTAEEILKKQQEEEQRLARIQDQENILNSLRDMLGF